MVCEALKKYKKKGINVFFVSNIDSKNINEVLNKIIPEKSLFIISSKSFTTIETLINANSAKKWFLKCNEETYFIILLTIEEVPCD